MKNEFSGGGVFFSESKPCSASVGIGFFVNIVQNRPCCIHHARRSPLTGKSTLIPLFVASWNVWYRWRTMGWWKTVYLSASNGDKRAQYEHCEPTCSMRHRDYVSCKN